MYTVSKAKCLIYSRNRKSNVKWLIHFVLGVYMCCTVQPVLVLTYLTHYKITVVWFQHINLSLPYVVCVYITLNMSITLTIPNITSWDEDELNEWHSKFCGFCYFYFLCTKTHIFHRKCVKYGVYPKPCIYAKNI